MLNARFRWPATLSRFTVWLCGVSIIDGNLRVTTTPGVARKFLKPSRVQIQGTWRDMDRTPSRRRLKMFFARYSKPIAKPFLSLMALPLIVWRSAVFVHGTTAFFVTDIHTLNRTNAMLLVS